jgi:hypothetical protein
MGRSCWYIGSRRRSRINKILGDGRLRGSWRHGALAGILSEDQEELEVAGKELAYTDYDNSSRGLTDNYRSPAVNSTRRYEHPAPKQE